MQTSGPGLTPARRDVIAHLRRVAPGHHYATSMAPPAAQQIVSALRLLRGEDGSGRGAAKLAALPAKSNWFRRRLLELGCHVLGDWDSPVMVRSRAPRAHRARPRRRGCTAPVLAAAAQTARGAPLTRLPMAAAPSSRGGVLSKGWSRRECCVTACTYP